MRVILIGLLAAGCARQPTTPLADVGEEISELGAEAEANVPYDAQFLDAMIAYADYTRDLANVGAKRATRDELRVHARNLAAQQEARLTELRNWRRLWYPKTAVEIRTVEDVADRVGVEPYDYSLAWKTPRAELDPLHPGDVENVEPIEGDGDWNGKQLLTALKDLPDPAFDAFYTATLVEHDRWGLQAARAALPQLQHPELQAVAGEVMTDNLLHIHQVAQWRDQWFGAQTDGVMPPEEGPGTR